MQYALMISVEQPCIGPFPSVSALNSYAASHGIRDFWVVELQAP